MSAIYTDILNAVKAKVVASMPDFTADNVGIVKELRDSQDTVTGYPFILIGPFGAIRILKGMNKSIDKAYPVAFVMIQVSNQKQAGYRDRFLQWHQDAFDLFVDQRLAGVPTVQRAIVDPRDVFDAQAWLSNKDVGGFVMRFVSRENRV